MAADEQNIILTGRTDLGVSLAPNYYYMHITRQKKAAQEQPYAFCIYVPVQSIEGPVPETIMYVLVCLLQANRAVHVQAGQAGSLLSLYGGNRSNRDTIALASCYHGPDSTLALMRKHPLSMYIFYRLLHNVME